MSEITSPKQEELLTFFSEKKGLMDLEKTLIEQEKDQGLVK